MDRFFKTSSPDWYELLKENARKNRENPTEAEYDTEKVIESIKEQLK